MLKIVIFTDASSVGLSSDLDCTAWHLPASLTGGVVLHTCHALQFQGQHPLRDRARKIDEGILVIR
jgi:hypothetical protein